MKMILGDCLSEMPKLDANSVDSIVTDPPYGLKFMGKSWDHGIPGTQFWIEALRVSKPGAYLMAFGGTRTFHRLAVAIEDAGWEIRDTIMWVYGSGFPKSHDVSKAIDREAGVERKVVGVCKNGSGAQPHKLNAHETGDTGIGYMDGSGKVFDMTAPATESAKDWQGWGTALKPAWEPIIVARKPLEGTVAENVQKWGTGAVNIDGCRVPANGDKLGGGSCVGSESCSDGWDRPWKHDSEKLAQTTDRANKSVALAEQLGRWPANLIHDGSQQVLDLFPQSAGQLAAVRPDSGNGQKTNGILGAFATNSNHEPRRDAGSAARFFYCAKASKYDRDEGMQEEPDRMLAMSNQAQAELRRGNSHNGAQLGVNNIKTRKNNHPTVKPTDLMRYLCRLVTPPKGIVLDPFMGSGSTGKAALLEGFGFIGIEREESSFKIALARVRL